MTSHWFLVHVLGAVLVVGLFVCTHYAHAQNSLPVSSTKSVSTTPLPSTIKPSTSTLSVSSTTRKVPVDGQWGPWSSGTCSVTCGDGVQRRTRMCNSPAPQNGGVDCYGLAVDSVTCYTKPCVGLDLMLDNEVAVVGSTVRFNCQVVNRGSGIIRYGKLMDGQKEPVHFSENGMKDTSVGTPTRYTFGLKPGRIFDDFTFDIIDLKPEDSGNYSCFVTGSYPYQTKQLLVEALPTSVQMIVDNTEVVDQTKPVSMIDEQQHIVKCVVKNSVPPAQISFTLDGQALPSKLIADRSVQIIKTTQVVDTAKPYLTRVMYETQSTVYLQFTGAEDNKAVGCTATTSGPSGTTAAALSLTKYFIPKFADHPPFFYCNEVVSAKLNEPFFFSCRVRAKPAVTSSSLTLHYENSTIAETLRLTDMPSFSLIRSHIVVAKQSPSDPEEYNINVTMNVTMASYGKYMFSTTNQMGTTEHVVTVERWRPSSAVERRVSVVGVTVGVLLAVLVQFMSSRRL